MPRLQLLLEREQAVLVAVVEHQTIGPLGRNLAAELGPDGACRSSHQNDAARQERPHARHIKANWLTCQQVVHLDLAHLREHDAAPDQFSQAGEHAVANPRFVTQTNDPPQRGARRRRDGDQHLVDLVQPDQLRDVVDATEHRAATDTQSHFRNVVVHEARDGGPEPWPALDLVEQADAGRSGAHDERHGLDVPRRRVLIALAPDPDGDARATHGGDAEQQIEKDHGAREVVQSTDVDQDDEEQHGPDDVAAYDVLDIPDADVLPPAGEEIGDAECDHLTQEQNRQCQERRPQLVVWDLEIEAEPECHDVSGSGGGQVDGYRDRGPVPNQHGMKHRFIRQRRDHAMALCTISASTRTSPSAPHTVSICTSVIAPKNGNARQRRAASSHTGKSPGRNPNRSR